MSEPVFIDASAWVAVTNRKDANHRKALHVFRRLLGSSTRMIATTWTAYEALTFVKSRLGYLQAERLWARLQARAIVDLVWIDEKIERDALELFWRFRDKTWGVVDCSSLAVMRDLGCSDVFAYDRHFVEASRQFGFVVLEK
jgi:predicted nucleic acid-binding protein